MTPAADVVVVTPVYGNESTLPELARRLADALDGRVWRLRIVVDASPDASLAVAHELAAADSRIAVTILSTNVGQHRALARGLADEDVAAAWVCLDADLQDPPEAVPALLDRLAAGDVEAVFAGRRGTYETRGRMVTGRAHRAVLGRLTGLPPDAGAFFALGPAARQGVIALMAGDGEGGGGAPSVVAAIGATHLPVATVPVERDRRPSGTSAWTSAARLRQSARTLVWAATNRRQPAAGTAASHRCTIVSE